MSNDEPIVSIGLPVYNGENYLAEALDSLLAQTYADFELIVSDNASTDKTQEICRTLAAKDKRLRYFRNERNLGLPRNWNRVFELSSGKYFKWAAYDDLYAPEYVERCVGVLERDPSIVLCYAKTRIIDERGRYVKDYSVEVDATSPKRHLRFYNMVSVDHWCFQIFGVVRAAVLKATPLHGYYYGSDRNLLTELALLGRLHEIPEYLFYRRDHPQSSNNLAMGGRERLATYYPANTSQTRFLGLRRFREYAASIRRVPLSRSERLLCYLELTRLAMEKSVNRLNQRGRRLARLIQA